ncbi:MAG: GNAT family N-acetyltransferase [Solirubrobacteraceae bacterium]|jgi:RimJ/RimL family protein N-acetyltransferase|nr:GNAT family N-acetyltransferase [Solirubrobacteraceae bacterium]MCU0312653.1 GNAT family N-acetyltransferase [Solirubrobacteraceae bacterium]
MELTLSSGTEVVIRPIRPDDKARLAAAMARLSDDSVRKRFLAPKPRLSGTELRYLTEIDYIDHWAEVAVLKRDPEAIVGVARWIRDPRDPASAEAAIVVGDALHGQGLGRALGAAIADAARPRDVRRFTATMLSDNVAAQRLFAAISERLLVEHDGATDAVVAELAA